MKQSVQIIGGKFRGKKLPFLKQSTLRPTPNAVRETLFNWLMHDIRDSICLDLFAGSGALGLEAYSRGAAKVTFVEKSLLAFQHLKKILLSFDTNSLQIYQQEACIYLETTEDPCQIVFLDPPFAENLIPICLRLLASKKILPIGGLVYVEAPDVIPIENHLWERVKQKKTGNVVYGLLRKIGEEKLK